MHILKMYSRRVFSGSVLGPPGAFLRLSLGRLGPSWGLLGLSWGCLGGSWCYLGAVLGRLGAILGHLGPSWAGMGAFRVFLGRLGAILGSSWAVLGPSWGPCWGYLGASWAVLERREAKKARALKSSKNNRKNNDFGLLGRSWEASWRPLEAFRTTPGPASSDLRASGGPLGPSLTEPRPS